MIIKADTTNHILVLILSVFFLFLGYNMCKPDSDELPQEQFFQASILSVGQPVYFGGEDTVLDNKTIPFTARITGGTLKDRVVEAEQQINNMLPVKPFEVKTGNRVTLLHMPDALPGNPQWLFAEHSKIAWMGALCLVFLACIILIGRGKGVNTIISLIFTILAIFMVYIPGILKGFNVYRLTAIVSVYVIFMSLLIINGSNRKTLCAVFGNAAGVLLSGLLAFYMADLLRFTGLIDKDYVFIMLLNPDKPIDLRAVMWSGIVIGSLGAVMDVSMSIASAMHELAANMKEKSFTNLMRSGMNIGKDAIGTMANTLILAYIGSSLAAVLLYFAYNKNVLYLLNTEAIATQILQAVAGSMGILFAVPLTAFVSAVLYTGGGKKRAPQKKSVV